MELAGKGNSVIVLEKSLKSFLRPYLPIFMLF